jgi:hypothetical protein
MPMAISLVTAAAVLATQVVTQDVSDVTLPPPTTGTLDGFTYIAGLRELSDGRLIVLDEAERAVYFVSADLTSVALVGRSGSGPGEYRLPSRLLVLSHDTTAIVDQSRLVLIADDGSPAQTVDILRGRNPATTGAVPQVGDTVGRLYAQALPLTSRNGIQQLVDSAAILRWRLGLPPDTAGFIRLDVSASTLAGTSVVSAPLPPFEPRPRWTVFADGRVAVVYPDPYHVEYFSVDGIRFAGATIRTERVPVTEGHREEFRHQARRPRPAVVRARGEPSTTIATMSIPFEEPEEWPTYLPPFLTTGGFGFAPDGKLWVERTTRTADGHGQYDVIDERGQLVQRVYGPAARRFAGFGRQAIYLIRKNDMDLEYLERFSLPFTQR